MPDCRAKPEGSIYLLDKQADTAFGIAEQHNRFSVSRFNPLTAGVAYIRVFIFY